MTTRQSKIEKLISKFCPNGVELKDLGKLASIETGTQLNKTAMVEMGDYPVLNGGINPSGFYHEYNTEENAIAISQGGASAGYVNFVTTKFWAGAHCFVVKPISSEIENRYLYFLLKNGQEKLQNAKLGAGIPGLNKKELQKFKIPIPPLAIQEEIVKILNSFTELEAELEAELEVRKKQYKYYFDRIFILDSKVETKKVSEVSSVFDSLHQTPKYSNTGFPMIRVTDIKGGYIDIENTIKVDQKIFETFTKKYKPQFNDIVISRVGSYGNFSLIGNGSDVCLGQNTSIIHPLINAKYLYYALNSKNVTQFVENNVGGGSQKTISLAKIKDIPIPVPSPVEQERIVSILDKFDALVNDISIGLPAELKARRQQYEYYRNKLLTFKELEK